MNRTKVLLTLIALTMPGALYAATLNGKATFSGTPPQLKTLDVSADPFCKKANPKPLQSEALVLGPSQSLGNVFVKIKSGYPAKEYPAPKDSVVIDQRGCHYIPHVVGVMKGQTLKILNSDGTLHNVHSFSKDNPGFNLAMPGGSPAKEKSFRKSEDPFQIKCDVHPWMEIWVGVMDHPYFAVTKTDGTYSIANLPAGTYEVQAWHEKLGTQVQKITLGASDAKSVDFTFTKK